MKHYTRSSLAGLCSALPWTVSLVLYRTDREAEEAMSAFQQLPQWQSPLMVLMSPQEMQVKGQHELVLTSRGHLKTSCKYDFSEAIFCMWSSQIQIKFKPLHCVGCLIVGLSCPGWLSRRWLLHGATLGGGGEISQTVSLFFLWKTVLKSISKRRRVHIFFHLCFIPLY